jgi:hypothetical protein
MPVGEGDSRLANTAYGAIGGLGGQALSKGVSRIAQPVLRNNTGAVDDAVDLLRREGVDLDVAQRTGSSGAQRLRSALTDNPLTNPKQVDFADKQARQFTRAVLRTIGADSDDVSADVLNKARKTVGDTIESAAKSNPARLDQQLVSEIQNIVKQAPDQGLDDASLRGLVRNVKRIVESAQRNQGSIPGDVFTSVRSNLSKLSVKAPLARDIEQALMDALDRAGGNSGALKQALARYRNIKIIEGAIDKGTDKLVSPLRLSNALATKQNRSLSQRLLGHPDSLKLVKLAQAGRELLPQAFADSGTAGRAIATEGLLFGGGLVGGLASGRDMETALAYGGGAAALPFLLQRGLLSQGNYLANGIPEGLLKSSMTSPITRAIINQSAIAGGELAAP